MKIFNPTLRNYLNRNKKITVIGLAWACYWRLSLVISAIFIIFYLVLILITLMYI